MIENWIEIKIKNVATLFRGISYKKEQASNTKKKGYLPVLRANNINLHLNFDKLVYVPNKIIKPEQLIKKGDIIIAMSSGSKHLVGKSAHATHDIEGSYGVFCALLRPISHISKKYIAFFFHSSSYKKLIGSIAKGTNINNLKREHILELNIPLPPLPEQRAIVAKIEALFSDLDSGIADLKKAREQLKTYRQAVLKKAFEGELTKGWRALRQAQDPGNRVQSPDDPSIHFAAQNTQGPGSEAVTDRHTEPVEVTENNGASTPLSRLERSSSLSGVEGNAEKLPTADELLEQIKTEREAYYQKQLREWEQAVNEWEAGGKQGKKPVRPKKMKELPALTRAELSELPELPEGWLWGKLGNVCIKIMDGTHFSPKNLDSGAYKYITAKNIKEGIIDLSNISYVSAKDHKEIYARCDVKKDDVLYIKDGATTGKAATNKLDEEFSLLSSVGVFRTPKNQISPKYLEYFLNSHVTRNRMLSNIAGVAITRLTLVKLNNSCICLCSLEEQNQIVREIESRLSVCDRVESMIEENLEKAEALRQSILKKAFEGKLLSDAELEACRKEPDWEPAEKLLERIRGEKKNEK
jgi:restriction endonuclease S subunit